MLKLKHFEPEDTDGFNAFVAEHPPRNTSKQSGIILNEKGITVFYEEGMPFTPKEQVAHLTEEIRNKRLEVLMNENTIRSEDPKQAELNTVIEEINKELQAIDPADTTKDTREVKKEKEQDLELAQNKIEASENLVLISKRGQDAARQAIVSMQSIIDDIESGAFVA